MLLNLLFLCVCLAQEQDDRVSTCTTFFSSWLTIVLLHTVLCITVFNPVHFVGFVFFYIFCLLLLSRMKIDHLNVEKKLATMMRKGKVKMMSLMLMTSLLMMKAAQSLTRRRKENLSSLMRKYTNNCLPDKCQSTWLSN